MKKLFLILIACGALSPVLAWADAGGAGATVTDDGQFNLCASYNCACSWNGHFLDNNSAPDALSCTKNCQNRQPSFIGDDLVVPADVTGDYQCLDAYGNVVKALPNIVPPTPVKDPIFPQLNVKIPGLCDMSPEGKCWGGISYDVVDGQQQSNLIGTYVKYAYLYLLGAATLVAVTMLMIAGLQYATARGDSKQVEQAKTRISNAVIGVILLLLAYNIAFLVDPATTTFNALGVQAVKGIQIDNETPVDFSESFQSESEQGPISVPLYDQKQYVDVAYGPESCRTTTSGNIKSSGCGVVSFSMAVAALTGQTINPPDVAKSFYEDGYRPLDSNGCGHGGTANNAMYESQLIAQHNLESRQIPISDKGQIVDLLSKGKLLIVSYRTSSGGGHYVLLSGYDSQGNIIVNDPYGGKREARSQDWLNATIKSAAYIDREADFIK